MYKISAISVLSLVGVSNLSPLLAKMDGYEDIIQLRYEIIT